MNRLHGPLISRCLFNNMSFLSQGSVFRSDGRAFRQVGDGFFSTFFRNFTKQYEKSVQVRQVEIIPVEQHTYIMSF